MAGSDRELRRTTFTQVPALYERARPGYPAELFDDLAGLAGVGPGCRVLEIGCGTGQATAPLAERGCRIVAVELGPEMAELARARLARFHAVEVVTAAFEDWPLPAEPFDLVLSATAFHWIDPEVRVRKSAEALRAGGRLATLHTHHVAGGTDAFFAEVQGCYRRFGEPSLPGFRLRTAEEIPSDAWEIDRSGRFGPTRFFRRQGDVEYSTAQYLDLLRTYSDVLRLEPPAREGLLECIGRVMDERFGGRIAKRYLWELRVAQRA